MARKTKTPRRPLPVRFVQLHNKLLIAAAVGVAVGLSMPHAFKTPADILIGWDVSLAIYLVWTLSMMRSADVEHIRQRAAEDDEGAGAVMLLSVAATAASFVAITVLLGGLKAGANPMMPGGIAGPVVLTITTIVMSWAFVHTIFAFHYAHEYYSKRHEARIGGLIFPNDDKPDYRDFLYFSLVIGMTSQTSDVDICGKAIRRMAAIHGVLAFFFNLVILALTVNTVASLI